MSGKIDRTIFFGEFYFRFRHFLRFFSHTMGYNDVVSFKEKIEKAELTIDRFDALVYPITKMRRKWASSLYPCSANCSNLFLI